MLLLDTDIMIDVLRRHPPALAWLTSLGTAQLALPGYVVMELIQGCRNKAEQDQLERALMAYQIVWPSAAACDAALASFSQHARCIGGVKAQFHIDRLAAPDLDLAAV